MKTEKILAPLLERVICVDLDAFYAPWQWQNPWTKWLKGKKVLIVHPFVECIKYKYENNRERLYGNNEFLLKFAFIHYIKTMQSQGIEYAQFKVWLEALKFMEDLMDEIAYEVSFIGSGAYGMFWLDVPNETVGCYVS